MHICIFLRMILFCLPYYSFPAGFSAYYFYRMQIFAFVCIYLQMKPESSQSKKDRLRKCEMASFLFAMLLYRRKTERFTEMMKRISFIHLCAKERDSANGYIYLARCRRTASMRTDRRSRTLLQYPTTLYQRKKTAWDKPRLSSLGFHS